MNIAELKYTIVTWFIALFFMILPNAWAQVDEYEMFPRIRSYLQRPASETQRYVEDVRVPRITEEEGIRTGRELPEEVVPEIPVYPEISLDKKIDPTRYIVGPGDLIKTYLWGELDKEYQNRITPEGYIIIPTVGALLVADHTLAEAREMIMQTVHKKYKDLDVTIYLSDPRRFRLYVSGLVERPGLYEANALMRVSDVLRNAEIGEQFERMGTSNVGQTGRMGTSSVGRTGRISTSNVEQTERINVG
ncbi:MAG TPA: polysaccharide biosynthesis/export family protein, partial [Anaerolineae bacterium]|nr:polysaccharide biosynthesis/export family protein [Anaerolineae bacterium]